MRRKNEALPRAAGLSALPTEKGRRAERNDRLLAVTDPSHRYRDCRRVEDIAGNVLDEIEQFFVVYNRAKDVRFTPLARCGGVAAQRLVKNGQRRFGERRAAAG